MILTQIESYAKKLFSTTAELGLKIVATTGNLGDKNHTKLIDVQTGPDRFNAIPALSVCFRHKGIKEYHVIMEANMWVAKAEDASSMEDIRKGDPTSVLIIMSVTKDETKVIAFDTMTMKLMENFQSSSFESSWASLMKCPEEAYRALPKDALPMLEDYWNNFSSIQI